MSDEQVFLDYITCLESQRSLHQQSGTSSSSRAQLLSVIEAVQRLASRPDLRTNPERKKLKVAVAEMQSRLMVVSRGMEEVSSRSFASSSSLSGLAGPSRGEGVKLTQPLFHCSTSLASSPPPYKKQTASFGCRELRPISWRTR